MAEEQKPPESPEAPPKEPVAAKPPPDPVRRWTFIVLILCGLLLAWYLRSDRVAPFTSQAKVNAVVVPIAPEVSGTITEVMGAYSDTKDDATFQSIAIL